MKTSHRSRMLLGIVSAATGGWLSARAADPGSIAAPTTGTAPAPAPAAPAPEFRNLRYDDSQATREAGLVYTKLGWNEVSDLSIGGQVRERVETWVNYNFNPDNDDDLFILSRLRLHGDLRVASALRFFVEARSAFVNDRDLPPANQNGKRPIDEDQLDLQNAFGDLSFGLPGDHKLTLRAGRQEMAYGKERVIGVGDWTNTRRTFDGVRGILALGDWRVDAFAVRPVTIQRYEFNDGYSGQDLYGVYAATKCKEIGMDLDLYALNRYRHNTPAAAPDDNRNTLGARVGGLCGASGFDYDLEAAYQFGDVGDGDIDAFSFASQFGYNVKDCPYASRIFLGYDYATGDDDLGDGDSSRYDQLYPTGHMYFGLIDAIGRQNIQDISLGLSARPMPKLSAKLEGHYFDRAEREDGVFDAGGNLIIPGGASDNRHIGEELDFSLGYQVDPHLLFTAGYGHLFAGSVVEDAEGDDISTGYVSGQYTF